MLSNLFLFDFNSFILICLYFWRFNFHDHSRHTAASGTQPRKIWQQWERLMIRKCVVCAVCHMTAWCYSVSPDFFFFFFFWGGYIDLWMMRLHILSQLDLQIYYSRGPPRQSYIRNSPLCALYFEGCMNLMCLSCTEYVTCIFHHLFAISICLTTALRRSVGYFLFNQWRFRSATEIIGITEINITYQILLLFRLSLTLW